MQTWESLITVGPFDQRPIERRDDVLVYRSAPLESDLFVAGPVLVTLFVLGTAETVAALPGPYAEDHGRLRIYRRLPGHQRAAHPWPNHYSSPGDS
jgi:hypothetical protein